MMSLKRLSMPVESAILPVESTDSTFKMLEARAERGDP